MKQSSSFVPAAKRFTPIIKNAPLAATLLAAGLMTACSSDSDSPAVPTDASITGVVEAAPVTGGSV